MDSLAGPAGSGITGATPDAIATTGTNLTADHTCAIFKVRPTAAVSGDWTIGVTGANATSSALYELSRQCDVLDEDSQWDTGGTGGIAFNLTFDTVAGDLIIAGYESGNPPQGTGDPDQAGDAVDLDDSDTSLSDHKIYVYSGAAAGVEPETVFSMLKAAGFKKTAAAAVRLG